jgi:hypothetical protein
MEYQINIAEGCTAGGALVVNGTRYSCEDMRYQLSLDQKEQFHNDLCDEIKRLLCDNVISVHDLVTLLPEVSIHYSETCEQCGDNVTTVYYQFTTNP